MNAAGPKRYFNGARICVHRPGKNSAILSFEIAGFGGVMLSRYATLDVGFVAIDGASLFRGSGATLNYARYSSSLWRDDERALVTIGRAWAALRVNEEGRCRALSDF